MPTQPQDITQSITEKVARWKDAFKAAVVNAGGGPIPEPADQLSYAEILRRGGERVTYGLLDQTVSRGVHQIGNFSDRELSLLHSDGYWDVHEESMAIFRAYDDKNFRLQAVVDGPIVVTSREGKEERLAFIFHAVSPSFRMLETLYETDYDVLVQLPDTFALEGDDFYTVKAVRRLDDHPELAQRIRELGL